jgi:hypothetical protein
MKKSRRKHPSLKQVGLLATTVALAGTLNGEALAFEIDTGNSDVEIRWDNTVRYNLAQRTQGRNGKIANSPNFDEGTYRFDKSDIVSNRLDILSEFDLTYKKDYGFRVSAAGWYDAAYNDGPNTRPSFSAIGSYPNNKYSGFTDRFYHGPSGEIMDAFVFANVDAGGVPVKLKAGRHTVVWGESLFLGGALHGIQYAQTPLDLQKGFATPGVEAKELFRPLNQISGQAQLTDSFSVAAQYFLDWEEYRFPEGGTFLGPVDPLFNGPKRAILSPNPALAAFGFAGIAQRDAVTPDKRGEYGISARWAVPEIDTTVGFYYRNYADKIPQVLVTKVGTVAGFPVTSRSDFRQVYADDIDLYGISFAKNIAGISFGAEISHRRNTPLVTPLFHIVATPAAFPAVPASNVPKDGETLGARGNTTHALVNALGVIAKTPVFDAATWAAELTYAKWNDVTKNKTAFQAEGYAAVCSRTNANVRLAGSPKWAGCVTDDYWGIALAFNPTWYQVFSGVDLSMPLTYARGLSGNAPTIFGGNEDLGNYSIGLSADIFQKHRVDLKYNQYFGDVTANAAGNAVATQNGFTSLLKDRGFVALTYKTTF